MLRKTIHTPGSLFCLSLDGLLSHYRIIREFYLDLEDCSKRPKVFGMTASPVDGKQDVLEAAKSVNSGERWFCVADIL